MIPDLFYVIVKYSNNLQCRLVCRDWLKKYNQQYKTHILKHLIDFEIPINTRLSHILNYKNSIQLHIMYIEGMIHLPNYSNEYKIIDNFLIEIENYKNIWIIRSLYIDIYYENVSDNLISNFRKRTTKEAYLFKKMLNEIIFDDNIKNKLYQKHIDIWQIKKIEK